jgi:hypothetical protein
VSGGIAERNTAARANATLPDDPLAVAAREPADRELARAFLPA